MEGKSLLLMNVLAASGRGISKGFLSNFAPMGGE